MEYWYDLQATPSWGFLLGERLLCFQEGVRDRKEGARVGVGGYWGHTQAPPFLAVVLGIILVLRLNFLICKMGSG